MIDGVVDGTDVAQDFNDDAGGKEDADAEGAVFDGEVDLGLESGGEDGLVGLLGNVREGL